VITIRFDTLVDAVNVGWLPSNVSGWGSCFGQPFSLKSGTVATNTDVSQGGLNWGVPCTPGADKYYLTVEFLVGQNPVLAYSEYFAVSREPQRPRYAALVQ
jgi:hypothetical protein